LDISISLMELVDFSVAVTLFNLPTTLSIINNKEIWSSY